MHDSHRLTTTTPFMASPPLPSTRPQLAPSPTPRCRPPPDSGGPLEGRREARKHQAQHNEVDQGGGDDLAGGKCTREREEKRAACRPESTQFNTRHTLLGQREGDDVAGKTPGSSAPLSLALRSAVARSPTPFDDPQPAPTRTCSMTVRLVPTHSGLGWMASKPSVEAVRLLIHSA